MPESQSLPPRRRLKAPFSLACQLTSLDSPAFSSDLERESIATSGGAVSIVHSKLSALWSALPALSIARTSKLWAPSASEL